MYNFSRTHCLRAKLGMSVFSFATALIVHDRIETYENHEDEKSFGFMIIGSIISSHNLKILRQHEERNSVETRRCNCRNKNDCPLSGECLACSIIYRADVSVANDPTRSKF